MGRPRKKSSRLSPALIQSIRESLDDFNFEDCYKTISLKAARVNAGYHRVEVAEILGVSENTVTRWENKGVTAAVFFKLCKLYRIEPKMVRVGSEPKSPLPFPDK